MANRYFSLAQVNRVIPELERIVEHLRSLNSEIREKEWQLKRAKVERRRETDVVDEEAFMREEAEIDFLSILVRSESERIRDLGGDLKGGYLVDFPGQIEGQDVLFCWKPGEPRILWYHSCNEGLVGRKPIPDQLLDDEESFDSTEEQ
ncbi:MAG: DUF2203 domain-containing protein [Mycobacterium leprae]